MDVQYKVIQNIPNDDIFYPQDWDVSEYTFNNFKNAKIHCLVTLWTKFLAEFSAEDDFAYLIYDNNIAFIFDLKQKLWVNDEKQVVVKIPMPLNREQIKAIISQYDLDKLFEMFDRFCTMAERIYLGQFWIKKIRTAFKWL